MNSPASRTTEGRGRLYDSIVDTVGNTPCIRLNRIAPKHVRLYVKAEFFNPASSSVTSSFIIISHTLLIPEVWKTGPRLRPCAG